MLKIDSLDHLVLTVSDVAKTCRFYGDVLGMDIQKFKATDGTTRIALQFGSQKINLHQAGAEFLPKAKMSTPGSADLCFLTSNKLSEWQSKLESAGIAIEAGPVERTGATGQILSLYIRDPDNNLIEISQNL